MSKPKKSGRLLACIWAVCAGLSVGAEAGVPFERALPEDCVAFINVRSFKELQSKAGRIKLFQMWHDPAMQPFTDDVKVAFSKALAELRNKTQIDVAEIAGYFSGQVAVALQMPKNLGPDSPPAAFILADVKGHEEDVRKTIEKFFAEGEKKGAVKRSVGDFTAIGPPDAQPRKMLAYKIENGLLVMGNDTDLLGAFLSQISTGASNALADNPRFKAFRSKVGGEGDIELFIDLNKIIGMAMGAADGRQREMMEKAGLQSLTSAGASISMAKDDFEVVQQLVVMKSGNSDIFNLFSMPAKPMKPENWAPANCESYLSFNWDMDLFYRTLEKLVNENAPGGMDAINKQLAGPDPDNPLIDLKRDIFESLGNRLSMISESATEKGMPTSKSLTVWEMRNGDRFAALIEKLMGMAGGMLPIQNKTVKGLKIYTFPAGEMLAAQNPNPDTPLPIGTIGFGVSKSQMYFATHVEVLDKVLQSEGSAGLAESSAYRRVAAKFPPQTSLISYTSTEASMQTLWTMLKSGQLKTIASQMENDDETKFIADLLKSLDGKKLPEFEKIKQYLVPTGGYGVMDESGVLLNFFSLGN